MKRALLLYNKESGRGVVEPKLPQIVERLSVGGYQTIEQVLVFDSNPLDGHTDIDLVIVSGGDGSINYVANAMRERGVSLPLAIIPAGTANDFALALGMSLDPLVAVEQILSGKVRSVDCGLVNDMVFVNILSFGLFTTTSQRTPNDQKRRLGKLAYIIEGLKELRTLHSLPLKLIVDGEPLKYRIIMALVFNGASAGGFHITRQASFNDGKLDFLLLEKQRFLGSAIAMVRYMLGGNPSAIKQLQAREIVIESPVNEPTDVDGQRGADFPLHISCLKGALQIIVPNICTKI